MNELFVMPKLVLFTANHYTSLEESEIQWLRKFQQESIIVTDASNQEKDAYSGTQLVDFNASKALIAHFIRHFFELTLILLSDSFTQGTSLIYIKKIRQRLSTLLRCSIIEIDLKERGVLNSKDIYYSYYANELALVLTLAIKRKHIKSYSTRAHGRDVIEDREPLTSKLPFQWLKYANVCNIYCVSRATQAYIQNLYPAIADKVNVSYLGTSDNSLGPLTTNIGEYTIISVGRVRNVKRFYLIAEMLKSIQLPIRWIHVGDVAEKDPTYMRFVESVKALNNNEFVRVEFFGYMENVDLLEFYQSNFIDVLINSSEFEGLPVSIQEAISFGIPCIATDVGGTSDIVNASTGVLLPKSFDPAEGAEVLSNFLKNKSRDIEFRKGVRDFWFMNFQAEINYPSFFATLSAHGTFGE